MGNRKSFVITKNIRKSFQIVVEGFSQLLSWIANIEIGEVSISAFPILLAKMELVTITIPDFAVSAIIHLKSAFSSTISFNIGTLIDGILIKYLLYPTLVIKDTTISVVSHIKYSLTGVSVEIPIGFSSTGVLVGVKNYLGDFVGRNPISTYYDDSTLGSMDTDILGDLDFTETA